MTGLSVSTIYRQLRDGRFPSRVRVGENAVRWRKSDILRWIEQLPEVGEAA